jgi:uncharacterized membrane protein
MPTNAKSLMTLEALRSVPLFSSLDDDATRELRDLLEVKDIKAATSLFRHGDKGDAMYLIDNGRVCISVKDSLGNDVTLAELAGGDFFGEMALLDGKPRSANATVVEQSRLAVLSRDKFITFVRRNPDVALKMLTAITERLRHTDEMLRQRVSRNANEELAARRTRADRLADKVAEFGGSWQFIALFFVLIFAWVFLNALILVKGEIDVYPYNMLDLIIGIIAGLQAPFILMSQNRQAEQDRLRGDLDYQVNLKNELSLTEVLRRLDVLESERLPKLFAEQNARIEERLGESSNNN